MGEDRGHGEGLNSMAGRKTGTVTGPSRGFKSSAAVAFGRPLPVRDGFNRKLQDRDVGQRLERKQAGLAKVIAAIRRAEKIESGRDRNKRIRLSQVRNIISQGFQSWVVGRILGNILVGSDQG